MSINFEFPMRVVEEIFIHRCNSNNLILKHTSLKLKHPGSALLKYCKYTRACTKGVLFRTSMYKMYVQETYCY